MCLAQGPQRSEAGKAQTRGPLFSSHALYHWATALPCTHFEPDCIQNGGSANIIYTINPRSS